METISIKQQTLRDKLIILMEKKNLKAAEIARITGRSEGTISDLLNSKKSFTDKLLNVIQDSLKDYLGEDDLVITRQYSKMWKILEAGKKAGDSRIIVGNTGIGKSILARKFAEENEACYYIKIDRKEMSWNNFLMRVVSEMGIKIDKNRKRYSTTYLLDRIISFVEEKADANPSLIIDETEIAKNSLFKDFKNLQTATEGLLNINIIGISDVLKRLGKISGLEYRAIPSLDGQNQKYKWFPTKDNSNIYSTFVRRFNAFRIDNINTDDISLFCAEKGITNKQVIKMACERWWNYQEANTAVLRAKNMGIDLSQITPEEFEIL